MLKFIIGTLLAVVLAVAAYYVWDSGLFSKLGNVPERSEETGSMAPQQVATNTYATTTFSIVYPDNFTVDDNYRYEGVPNKPIIGVKFTIPADMATGTNLSSDTYLSVEWLPRALNCTGDIYILPNVRAQKLTEAGVVYSFATTSSAAAGNLYEEMAYALTDSTPCIAVRYFIHSTNLGTYEPGSVREYDRSALLRALDAIRHSIILTQ